MEYTKLDYSSRISVVIYFGTCNSPVRTLLNIMFTEMYLLIYWKIPYPALPKGKLKISADFTVQIWGKKFDQEDVKKGGGRNLKKIRYYKQKS
jgi:hypothetical protein